MHVVFTDSQIQYWSWCYPEQDPNIGTKWEGVWHKVRSGYFNRCTDARTKDAGTERTVGRKTLGGKTLGQKTLWRKTVGRKTLGRQTRVWTLGPHLSAINCTSIADCGIDQNWVRTCWKAMYYVEASEDVEIAHSERKAACRVFL